MHESLMLETAKGAKKRKGNIWPRRARLTTVGWGGHEWTRMRAQAQYETAKRAEGRKVNTKILCVSLRSLRFLNSLTTQMHHELPDIWGS